MFLGAVEEQGAIAGMESVQQHGWGTDAYADTLQRLVLVILINLTCYTAPMLLNHHMTLPWQFVGKEEVAQRGLWDVTVFLGSIPAMPVIFMVFYSLP